ncbi:beta-N-acetylhexosaminidase [Gracilibacillus oryzae]|uniref:Beta-N-acetylhexosaminidase n=1 Tax=Gracilibacillus oryzae TaxID=1672701 RepID=A0A7C8GQZ4_9BACI|nr:beta-N-acetylhexosaminidase [Gracilibacillus oryzae]KAB8126087.1 beta-N-acetylhexosaminidase [Gracilibacillus oryzae]
MKKKRKMNWYLLFAVIPLVVAVIFLGNQFLNSKQSADKAEESVHTIAPADMEENEEVVKIEDTIEKINQSAQIGKIPDIPLVAGKSNYQEVLESLGEPNQSSEINGANYAEFPTKKATIGYKDKLVFDIRSSDPAIQEITYQEIKGTLGEPSELRYFQDAQHDQIIMVYHTDSPFLLKWILPKPTETNANPNVDHIAVYTELPETDDITEMIANMSLEEKIGQMIIGAVSGTTMNANSRSLIKDYKIGGFIFYSNNLETPEQTITLLNQIKAENEQNRLPLFLSVDQEGGRISRLPGNLIPFPTNQKIGEINNAAFSYDIGTLLAKELKAFGFNLDFAPVLDVNSNPNNPIIGDRSFGNNPQIVSELGIQTMKGIQSQNVIPVIKHFPGHGDTSVDSHLQLPEVNKSLAELKQLELVPFERAIKEGADVVMIAHILLPEIDSEFPSSMSQKVITDILRKQLQFNGVIMTDDMKMKAIADNFSIGKAAVQSVKAGNEIILIAHDYDVVVEVMEQLKASVQNGEISEERINSSVRRIIQLKEKYELNTEKVDAVDIDGLNQSINSVLNKDN